MNNRTPILNELQAITPGLVHLPAAMPYTVPEGYFDSFAENLLAAEKNNDFTFLSLPKIVQMPYQVPAGYFENLPMAIVRKVNSTYSTQNIPEGYFETLPAILLNKVRHLEVTEELESIAPLLNTISKQPVQAVPEGYFEQLQPSVEQLTLQQPPVISIKRKMGWAKYAVAASIVLMVSFGAYRYFDKTPTGGFVAVTPEQVKILDKQLAQLDNATIENYLQENESVTEVNANWYENAQDDDIEELLQDFTDQELQQQLKENADLSATTEQKKT